jgi:hypothetical protein
MSLEYDSLNVSQMPKGIGRLKQLRSLNFIVARNDNEAKQGCSIRELQSLNLLVDLDIKNLHKNLSLEDAKSVELVKKNHLEKLVLKWKYEDVNDHQDINRVTGFIEKLRPPSSLLNLSIYNYSRYSLPKWMSSSIDISLNNLLRLKIDGCKHCQQLPGFGKLPQLKYLDIVGASRIEKIGPEFLGRGDESFGTHFVHSPS